MPVPVRWGARQVRQGIIRLTPSIIAANIVCCCHQLSRRMTPPCHPVNCGVWGLAYRQLEGWTHASRPLCQRDAADNAAARGADTLDVCPHLGAQRNSLLPQHGDALFLEPPAVCSAKLQRPKSAEASQGGGGACLGPWRGRGMREQGVVTCVHEPAGFLSRVSGSGLACGRLTGLLVAGGRRC